MVAAQVNGSGYAVWSVAIGDPVFILGACFDPNDVVWITYCDTNEIWTGETANECGAVFTPTNVPVGLIPWDGQAVSVRAWIDDGDRGFNADEDELVACWPLYIEEEEEEEEPPVG